MSFELNLDAGGDASADASPAISEVESGDQVVTPDEPTTLDSGIDTPADPTLTTEPDTGEEPADESVPEDEEAALLAAAEDPNTPAWARAKIQEAMKYANRLKGELGTFKTEAETLRTQYEGKDVLPQAEVERLKAAEEQVYNLQSITATPEQIDKTLKEMNPRVYGEYRNHLVWNALEKPDGTPDLDNLQFIVDKFAGESGKVSAKDVLAAVDALKNERITPYDLHEFDTTEEYEAFQRRTQQEKVLNERQAELEHNAKYQETQIRTGELNQAVGQIQSQVAHERTSLLEKFKLTPQPNEPKAATDYKARINARLEQVVNQAPGQIRELGEIVKIFELLGQPGKKPLAGQAAAEEVRRVINSPQFQQTAAKATSVLKSQMEEVVSQEAYFYTLMMKGLELENSTKPAKARPVIGAPNQTAANLPQYTEADLARMSAAERSDYTAQALSEQLRSLSYGNSRMGQ